MDSMKSIRASNTEIIQLTVSLTCQKLIDKLN